MSRRLACAVALVLMVAFGCKNTPIAKKTAPPKVDKLPEWDWAGGIPKSIQRADLVAATLDTRSVASLLPSIELPGIQLASASSESPTFQVVRIGEKPIQNCEQLHAAVERANQSKDRVELAILPTGAAAGTEPKAVEVAPATLIAVEQAVAQKHKALRVTEEGNSWILLCDGDCRCEVMARVERSKGLLQVVTSLGVVRGSAKQLPVEVLASCNDKLLRCLTAAEALELLYDPQPRALLTKSDDPAQAVHYSFAAVSAMDDYAIPTNYKRLEEQTKRATGLPALAVVPGMFYPGSPLLGDARALSGFLQQQHLCVPGEPQKLGWIVFAGESLKQGGTIQLEIDLGSGPKKINLMVPKP